METPEFFDPSKMHNPEDPSMPRFHFNEAEREERRLRGMTDKQIDQEEVMVTNRQAEAKFREERKKAA